MLVNMKLQELGYNSKIKKKFNIANNDTISPPFIALLYS